MYATGYMWRIMCGHFTWLQPKVRREKTYNIGGHCEKTNLEVIEILCDTLETLNASAVWPFRELITFVKDRPGHDQRYAIDASKIECELGWKPAETFESGIRKTVEWYVDNQDWCRSVSRQDSRL